MLIIEIPSHLRAAINLQHTEELIELFRGYIRQMPQHTEYYESVITHLNVIREGEEAQLERELECHEQH